MKKRLLTFLFLMTAVFCFGQEESGHLLFKGIPIDGTLKEFVTKLEAKGYELIDVREGSSLLKGNFAGFKDCIIVVNTITGKDLVYSASVLFEKYDTWRPLETDYLKLKTYLTIKYGAPEQVEEKFPEYEKYNIIPDDIQKMSELLKNTCSYSSVFRKEKGTIFLTISSNNKTTGSVGLVYRDQLNYSIENIEALEDL